MKAHHRIVFELIAGLQQEIEDTDDARYAHRVHCVVLVLQGMSAREVAFLFGDPPRSVQRWVERFNKFGLSGLVDTDRPGPARRLSDKQILELGVFLRMAPSDFGMPDNLWDGKNLSAFIEQRFQVKLSVRQCQNLFHEFGFRLRAVRLRDGKFVYQRAVGKFTNETLRRLCAIS